MNTKQTAILSGAKHYQGKPCKKGHIGKRFTANSDCIDCATNRQNTENRKKYLIEYRATSTKLRSYQAVYHKAYEQLTNVKEIRAQYRKTHAAQWTAKTRKYQAAKLQRTPLWIDAESFWMIEEAYVLAALRTKMFGFQWEVDHMIPLQGKLASGLHVPHNLQVIPKVENRGKSNKFVIS